MFEVRASMFIADFMIALYRFHLVFTHYNLHGGNITRAIIVQNRKEPAN